MSETVIELQDLSMCYRLARQRIPSVKEYAIHLVKGALSYEQLWALKNIDLRVKRGERLGVVGRNGAGKSTLLKVVSGVLKPTRGTAKTTGSIAPILELGTGFDFELTGYENIYLNALLLGRSNREIDAKVDEIVEFSGLANFIRTPIRNYSTGMLARLGFSIATAWIPDVLILDEVLAVGDARFVRRCDKRLTEVSEAGTAILLVSHDLPSIRNKCQEVLWLESGRVRALGPPDEVLDQYTDFSDDSTAEDEQTGHSVPRASQRNAADT